MIKQIMICDMCKEEIPIVKKRDMFGIEREYYRLGRIEVDNYNPDLSLFGIHMCERCCARVSMDIMKWKIEAIAEMKR